MEPNCVVGSFCLVSQSGPLSTAAVASSFEEFYAVHHVRVERALVLALGDVELGRDACAEGFARALGRWSEVTGYSNPTGWVFRVGINWARSRHRRRRREVAPVRWLLSEAASDSTADLVAVEDDVMIAEALSRLSLDHRAVVVGRFYLDLSEAQLAEALDIPQGTVKSRSSRALGHLHDFLKEVDDER